MKTTIDLPDALVRQLKVRAAREGRKVKDLAAQMLREGLARPRRAGRRARPAVVKDKLTGLPVVQCRRRPGHEGMSAEAMAEVLLEQESAWALGTPER